MEPTRFQLVDTPPAATAWLATLSGSPNLAVDFEADGLFSYREKICLIQCTDRGRNHIIDPLSVPEVLEGLVPVLADPGLAKIFHGADYDVRLWKRATGSPIRGLFDTMIAAQLCGREQVGLAALLEAAFGVQLDKRYQKANWNQRPLQSGMLEYAALDTAYLLPLKERLEQELMDLGRKHWAEEEFQLLEGAEPAPPRSPSCFDVKGARRLAPRQLATLQTLLEVRERAAAEWDKPPFKVLNNAVLTAWALRPPRSRNELLSAPGANRRTLTRLASQLWEAVRRGQETPFDQCPRGTGNGSFEPLTPGQEKRLQRLKKARTQRAEALRLPVGLLVNTATLERLARYPAKEFPPALNSHLKKWQREVMGDDLLAAAGD